MFKLVIWRPVVDCNNKPIDGYLISNFGNIYSVISNKILKDRIDKKGYNNVCLKGRNFWKISRLTALAFPEFCGVYFEGAEVDHTNGVRADNRAENLKWVTHTENVNNPLTLEQFKTRRKCEHNEEWRRKVSEKNKGKSRPDVKRKIIMDGEIIFEGVADAQEYLGLKRFGNAIHRVLKGKRKHYKGHTFEYV